MLCRVLLAAIAISYLVCVLFLSGIQKEDLDVSLLKKMQHHDIDYDKNNEKLRMECLSNSNNLNSKTNSEQNTTEKENEVAKARNITTTVTTAATLDTRELKSVLKYLKHKKKIRNPTTTESYKWKYLENTDKVKNLFEKLMSESDDSLKKVYQYSSPNDDKKESSLEEEHKYLQPYIEKLDSNPKPEKRSNTTENKTSIELPGRKKDNATKETINNGVDISNFKDFEQIRTVIAKYLSKKHTVSTTTQPQPQKKVTKPARINAHEIEQKLASSIAAINQLNENIAILQRNINGEINSSIENKENKFKNVAEREMNKNIAKAFPDIDSPVTPAEYAQDVSKVVGIANNYDISKTNPMEFYNKIQINKLPLNSNNQLKFTPEVNNFFDTVTTGQDKQRYIDSPMLNNAKNSQIQYNPNLQDIVAPKYGNDNQKPSYHLTEAINPAAHSSINNKFEFTQQNIKEITNYSNEKQRIPDNIDAVNIQKNYHNDPILPYNTQNLRDNMMNYAYYNQRQPESHVQRYQYSSDGLESSPPQEEKFVSDDIDEGVVQNNVDLYKNSQMQYATQIVQDGIKNRQDAQYSGFINQNGLESHIPNLKENPLNYNLILNKSNNTKKDQINSLSFDMISKIAESVKEIVLKDLKKEIISSTMTTVIPLTTTKAPTAATTISSTTFTTPSPTTSTTFKPTTITFAESTTAATPTKPLCITTPAPVTTFTVTTTTDLTNKSQKIYDSKVLIATQAIEKFIKLFEEMKSVQEKTVKNNAKISSTKIASKPAYNVPIVMFPPPLSPMSPYGIRVPAKQMPIIVHNYIPPTLNGPPFPPTFMTSLDTTNSISPIHKPLTFETQHFPNAVMIQTNKDQIQPLGVPMVQPEAINLNIVLTTQNPFWSKQENRWNNMYKYNRSPDKQNDIRTLKNSLNAYSNNKVSSSSQVDNNMNNNKVPNKNAALLNNNSSVIENKIRLDILKQFDSYNKQESADKNKKAFKEINNPGRYNELETNKNTASPNINIENYINDSNFRALIIQLAKRNENLLNMPHNNRIQTNPLDNVYKDFRIIPNIRYRHAQKGELTNQMAQYKDLIRPDNFQDDNTQFITKENMLDGINQINQFNIASEPFNPTRNNDLYNLHETVNNRYLKPTSYAQIHNVDAMPVNEKINNYSNQPKLYQNYQLSHLNSHPNLENQIQNFKNLKYQYNTPTFKHLENMVPFDETKSTFKNLEKYFYSPSPQESIKMIEKALLNKERDYLRPKFKNQEFSNDFSGSMNKMKMKFENPGKFYNSPSDEDSYREFKPRERAPMEPYHSIGSITGINRITSDKQRGNDYSRFQNKKIITDYDQPQIDRINYAMENRNVHKISKQRILDSESDRNHRDRNEYRPRVETSDTDMKSRRPHTESSDSDYKYAGNVKGFHEKLESSDGWLDSPSDCGPGERCMSSVKILSRQQVPLDNSKKPAKYDDSRFKNFLKTQQKVNHMLEMILATKADELRSVETI